MPKKVIAYCVGAISALLCVNALAQSNSIGRVFFSPQERRALEAKAGKVKPSTDKSKTVASRTSALTFNGSVKRSGGRTTAWINGTPLDLLSNDKRRQYRLNGDRLLVDDAFGKSQLSAGEKRQRAVQNRRAPSAEKGAQ